MGLLSWFKHRMRYGYSIGEDMYLKPESVETRIVTFKDRSVRIGLAFGPGRLYYLYINFADQWLPPHHNEAISREERELIIDNVKKSVERYGKVEFVTSSPGPDESDFSSQCR